jgi:ABC-2 type transport system ATP-binding protein
MIEIKSLTKDYKNVRALDNVTLTFEENKIYGLLGRNGVGKSTLLNIITDKVFPSQGEVLVDGEKVSNNDEVLGKMFLMNEKNYYPESMKVYEIFNWTNEFYPDFDLVSAFELADKFKLNTKSKVKALSTGYASIFKAIVALCSNTKYILLDEPVLGLDANHRDLLYKVILDRYANNPKTIIISTHLIEEVSSVIEEIVIIHNGKVLLQDSCENVLSSGYTITGKIQDVDEYIDGKDVISTETFGGLKNAYVKGKPQNVPSSLEVSKLDLQKLFIQLTNDKEGI